MTRVKITLKGAHYEQDNYKNSNHGGSCYSNDAICGPKAR